MLTIQDERDLVTAVHDGPFEQPLWSTFLDRLRQRVRATYSSLAFRPPGRDASSMIELFSGQRLGSESRVPHRQELHASDPVPYLEMREGRVYDLTELLDEDDPGYRDFLANFVAPGGMIQNRLVRVTEPSGVSAWLTVARDKVPFTSADSALLSAIVPHLQRALRNHVALERERMRATISGDAMQRMDFGWITLDSGQRIIDASAHGQHLLRHCAHLRLQRGLLVSTNPSVDRQLAEAIKACAIGSAKRPRALHVSREPWFDLLIVPVAPAEGLAEAPVAIAYLQGDNRSAADRHAQIAEMFGLLPSEARFALALSRGLSISEAAVELNLTIETARNYSKKVYSKTGARGQGDLIRIILASVLALA